MGGEIAVLSGFCFQIQYASQKNDEDESTNNENVIIMEQDITFIHTDEGIEFKKL